MSYLTAEAPAYSTFEDWVCQKLEGRSVAAAAERWNDFVRNRIHNDAKRTEIHATIGRSDDGSLRSAPVLNHVEDWHLAHAMLVSG